ncbi:uncharacterized protein PFL1_03943 [Pseudozyma flocculosa PF-1]|nr:uncharacterized protein PFL1_03943 [Pseudozyma flocculosa PF-1]EPQ28640.1 hypothetical protein PFL1_03943 [Pseudozyma flocculosa PF-1]
MNDLVVVHGDCLPARKEYVPMDYTSRLGHLQDSFSHRAPYAELDDADYDVTNSSSPSLSYSVSTHAESIPSSIGLRDRDGNGYGYANSDYASELGQQTPYEDDSDLDSLQHVASAAAPRTRVKFMTPTAVTRESSTTTGLRPIGTKRRAQRLRPSTAPMEPAHGKMLPDVPVPDTTAAMAALALDGEQRLAGSRRRTCSNAADTSAPQRRESLTLAVDNFPSPPSRSTAAADLPPAQNAPLSVLDEFDWHGTRAPTAASQYPPSASSQHHAGMPGTIRSKASIATLMPRRDEIASVVSNDGDHPFAFSPPSLSHEHDGFDDVRSQPDSGRHSLNHSGPPSVLSHSSNSSLSNELEPRELLRRAKTSKITCGLDEELGQAPTHYDADAAEAEVIDDLPPLLSTYYLAEQGLSKEQFERLTRNPERLRAAQLAAARAEMERKGRSLRSSRRGGDDEEPVSILAAEAKFLAQDPHKSGGGGKISSLLKKKSTSSAMASSSSSSSSSSMRGTRPERLQRIESRSEVSHLSYRDGNGGIYSPPLSNRSGTASVASSSSRDLRSGGATAGAARLSEPSLASHGSAATTPSKGLSKLFGRKR